VAEIEGETFARKQEERDKENDDGFCRRTYPIALAENMDELLKKLNKDYGNVATPGNLYPKADFVPSGIYAFDAITGGGAARGHMTEVHGLEGVGKTTFCVQAIKNAQSLGYSCALVDAERRLNPDRVEYLGVDLSRLLLLRPTYGEQACEIMRDIIESGEIDLLILDSMPALSSKSEQESTEGGGQMSNHAKMWAQFLRKIIPGWEKEKDKKKTAFIVINQMRENIVTNQYAPGAKDLYVFPGGRSQKYFASNRVEIKKIGKVTDFGFPVRFKSAKTSFMKPFMEVETFFDWEKGFLPHGDLLERFIQGNVLTKDGAGYFLGGEKIAHGEAKMRKLLEDEAFVEKLKAAL